MEHVPSIRSRANLPQIEECGDLKAVAEESYGYNIESDFGFLVDCGAV